MGISTYAPAVAGHWLSQAAWPYASPWHSNGALAPATRPGTPREGACYGRRLRVASAAKTTHESALPATPLGQTGLRLVAARPLTADQQATRDAWARWRAEQGS